MKWSNRLRERKTERWNAPLVWWVRQGEAEKKIKEMAILARKLERERDQARLEAERYRNLAMELANETND